jgi:uncharacterized protein
MSLSMHSASVPLLTQMLTALSGVLAKAEADAAARKVDPAVLLQYRLAPDMFPLVRQVQIAADFAKGTAARLAGVEVPSWPDDETTFDQLHARIRKTLDFIASLDAGQFEGSDAREIVLRPGTEKEQRFDGRAYLVNYAIPQFLFHVTTAYAILRHAGVGIGKKDFMGVR